jgi:FlaA1/EpsC-like NDP-sugar epimerase
MNANEAIRRGAVAAAKGILRYRWPFVLLLQSAIILFSLVAAYMLRFDYQIPKSEQETFRQALIIVLVVKLVALRVGHLDRGWSRFVGMKDLASILLTNLLATTLFVGVLLTLVGTKFPRSVYCIDLLVCFLVTATMRCSARIYHELFLGKLGGKGDKRMLIYGAGESGAALLKEIHNNRALGYRVVGFLDDNPLKWHTTVLSVPVLGSGRSAAPICAKYQRKRAKIDEIVIAMPSATGQQMREALANCRSAGVLCKTIPGVGELLTGKVLAGQIREVSVLDLLGREPVHLEETLIRKSIEGRSVMVTGAAGSIGSEICRQVGRFSPSRLVLFEQAESDLFRIHNQMVAKFPELTVCPQIGDIRDYERVDELIKAHRVDSIFHAAAYKHVPMMEGHVLEAVKNNILGTRNVVFAAQRNQVANFLMISSDKAVNPTNVMGATKRVAELIVSSLPVREAGGRTKCVSVRFGNVLGSNGSVVPLFKEQIANGGPVTVTHPDMRRYFMTIPEAVQLVLQASTMGKGSEIFVLDMGEAVKIVDLARNMIRLSGQEPDVDIEVRFTGLRPGEKLFEEITTEGENILSTYHEKIKIFSGRPLHQIDVAEWLETLEAYVDRRDEAALIDHICGMVPEYNPSRNIKRAASVVALSASRAG